MVKIGTLRDFQTSLKKIREAGLVPIVYKSPNDLYRSIKVDGKVVLTVSRIKNSAWSFLYDNTFWSEKHETK